MNHYIYTLHVYRYFDTTKKYQFSLENQHGFMKIGSCRRLHSWTLGLFNKLEINKHNYRFKIRGCLAKLISRLNKFISSSDLFAHLVNTKVSLRYN